MWPYDSDEFDPPAPVVPATLIFDEEIRRPVRMQIDSGADLTCIPSSLAPTSKTIPYGITYVSGYDGEVALRKTFFVSIQFGGNFFPNVEVLPIEGSLGLLGRDVLNALEIKMNGPAQELEIVGGSGERQASR